MLTCSSFKNVIHEHALLSVPSQVAPVCHLFLSRAQHTHTHLGEGEGDQAFAQRAVFFAVETFLRFNLGLTACQRLDDHIGSFDAYHAIIAINTKFLRPSNTARSLCQARRCSPNSGQHTTYSPSTAHPGPLLQSAPFITKK